MGKGEIARYEQFLLFQQCLHNDYFPGASKGVIVWEWVNAPSFTSVTSTTATAHLPAYVLSFTMTRLNSLPSDKILDQFKLKAFADDKINVTQKLKFAFGKVENIVGKGENAGYQHFLHFRQCFQKATFSGSFKVGIVW